MHQTEPRGYRKASWGRWPLSCVLKTEVTGGETAEELSRAGVSKTTELRHGRQSEGNDEGCSVSGAYTCRQSARAERQPS